MSIADDNLSAAEAAELSEEAWLLWAAAHPELEQEVLISRQIRWVVGQLRLSHVEVPVGFEVRLMERLREDMTLFDLIDLGLGGLGRAFLELLMALVGLLPQPQPALQAQSGAVA